MTWTRYAQQTMPHASVGGLLGTCCNRKRAGRGVVRSACDGGNTCVPCDRGISFVPTAGSKARPVPVRGTIAKGINKSRRCHSAYPACVISCLSALPFPACLSTRPLSPQTVTLPLTLLTTTPDALTLALPIAQPRLNQHGFGALSPSLPLSNAATVLSLPYSPLPLIHSSPLNAQPTLQNSKHAHACNTQGCVVAKPLQLCQPWQRRTRPAQSMQQSILGQATPSRSAGE